MGMLLAMILMVPVVAALWTAWRELQQPSARV